MENFNLAAFILCISAVFSVFNAKVLRWPESIGLMTTGLFASIFILIVGSIFPGSIDEICHRVASFDFSFFVLTVVLGFLIFAGALSSDSKAMAKDRWPIIVLSTVGIFLSTMLVGVLTFGMLQWIQLDIPFIHCLLFGALISPTDPIAVLAILKETAVPRSLQADIAGESLFNDGVAVVVFITLLQLAGAGHTMHASEGFNFSEVFLLFGREVLGGGLLGSLFGVIAVFLMRLVKVSSIDILVSVAAVVGCYSIANLLHVSGPLALVFMGLIVGKQMLAGKTSKAEKKHLSQFWEAIDHILNAILFSLMGFVLLGLSNNFTSAYLLAGLIAIPIVLFSRVVSVALPLPFTKLQCGKPLKTISILSWGGLRGGISIALALSLATDMSRDLILYMTYSTVVFSVLVQGLTIGKLVDGLRIDIEKE